MAKIAQYHAHLHDGSMPAPHLAKVSGEFAIGAVDRAVDAAADELIGALVDRHYRVGSIFDDIGNAFAGLGETVLHGVQDTVHALKGPITAAASVAATAIPGVGPIVAPMAAQLVGPILDTATNLGRPAHPAVTAAQQRAKTDPHTAQALAAARAAAAHTAAAFHVASTAHQASAGNPNALQQITQLAGKALQGNSTAQGLISAATNLAGSTGGFDLSSLTGLLSGIL
jgi:hypothetical protein